MRALEFSTQVTSGKQLVIPLSLQEQLEVGEQVRVVVLIDPPLEDSDTQSDIELKQLVNTIRQTPPSSSQITPATKTLTEEDVAYLLRNDNPNFDPTEWNAMWDAHEQAEKARATQDTHNQLNDAASHLS